MYEFIRLQYIMGKIDTKQVAAFVPQWITQQQAQTILAQ